MAAANVTLPGTLLPLGYLVPSASGGAPVSADVGGSSLGGIPFELDINAEPEYLIKIDNLNASDAIVGYSGIWFESPI